MKNGRPIVNCARGAALAALLFVAAGGAAQADEHGVSFDVRLGLGVAISEDTSFSDENCASTDPLAYFGCGLGSDGRPLGAYGDFSSSFLIDAGIGLWLQNWLRTEATFSYRPDLGFDGQANFPFVPGDEEPISSDVESFSVLATGYVYPAPLFDWDLGPVSPFVSAGLGVAYNHTSQMDYEFPTLGPGSATITQGGSNTDFAWSVGAGLDVDLAEDWVLSLAYRYSDLGDVVTNGGDILVIRPPREFTIPVGETMAPLQLHEIFVSLRYAF
ncbi:MAG: outer membrane beta-barrel protein [Pseudomonadota bacterium]